MQRIVNPKQTRLFDPFDSVLTEKTRKRRTGLGRLRVRGQPLGQTFGAGVNAGEASFENVKMFKPSEP